METSNERLLEGARNLKKKGYSPEEVDAWLQTKGSSLDAMKSFATQQKQTKLPQVSDEARAEINANIEAYENPSWLKRLKNAAEINHASNEGFIEGIDNALNRAVNAVTLGAFNKASQLTGGNEYLKNKAIRERNESEGLGVADTLFNLSLNLYMFFALNGTTSVRDLNIAQDNIEKYQIIGVLVFAVLNLLMSIYVVAKGRKAPKDLEPEVA